MLRATPIPREATASESAVPLRRSNAVGATKCGFKASRSHGRTRISRVALAALTCCVYYSASSTPFDARDINSSSINAGNTSIPSYDCWASMKVRIKDTSKEDNPNRTTIQRIVDNAIRREAPRFDDEVQNQNRLNENGDYIGARTPTKINTKLRPKSGRRKEGKVQESKESNGVTANAAQIQKVQSDLNRQNGQKNGHPRIEAFMQTSEGPETQSPTLPSNSPKFNSPSKVQSSQIQSPPSYKMSPNYLPQTTSLVNAANGNAVGANENKGGNVKANNGHNHGDNTEVTKQWRSIQPQSIAPGPKPNQMSHHPNHFLNQSVEHNRPNDNQLNQSLNLNQSLAQNTVSNRHSYSVRFSDQLDEGQINNDNRRFSKHHRDPQLPLTDDRHRDGTRRGDRGSINYQRNYQVHSSYNGQTGSQHHTGDQTGGLSHSHQPSKRRLRQQAIAKFSEAVHEKRGPLTSGKPLYANVATPNRKSMNTSNKAGRSLHAAPYKASDMNHPNNRLNQTGEYEHAAALQARAKVRNAIVKSGTSAEDLQFQTLNVIKEPTMNFFQSCMEGDDNRGNTRGNNHGSRLGKSRRDNCVYDEHMKNIKQGKNIDYRASHPTPDFSKSHGVESHGGDHRGSTSGEYRRGSEYQEQQLLNNNNMRTGSHDEPFELAPEVMEEQNHGDNRVRDNGLRDSTFVAFNQSIMHGRLCKKYSDLELTEHGTMKMSACGRYPTSQQQTPHPQPQHPHMQYAQTPAKSSQQTGITQYSASGNRYRGGNVVNSEELYRSPANHRSNGGFYYSIQQRQHQMNVAQGLLNSRQLQANPQKVPKKGRAPLRGMGDASTVTRAHDTEVQAENDEDIEARGKTVKHSSAARQHSRQSTQQSIDLTSTMERSAQRVGEQQIAGADNPNTVTATNTNRTHQEKNPFRNQAHGGHGGPLGAKQAAQANQQNPAINPYMSPESVAQQNRDLNQSNQSIIRSQNGPVVSVVIPQAGPIIGNRNFKTSLTRILGANPRNDNAKPPNPASISNNTGSGPLQNRRNNNLPTGGLPINNTTANHRLHSNTNRTGGTLDNRSRKAIGSSNGMSKTVGNVGNSEIYIQMKHLNQIQRLQQIANPISHPVTQTQVLHSLHSLHTIQKRGQALDEIRENMASSASLEGTLSYDNTAHNSPAQNTKLNFGVTFDLSKRLEGLNIDDLTRQVSVSVDQPSSPNRNENQKSKAGSMRKSKVGMGNKQSVEREVPVPGNSRKSRVAGKKEGEKSADRTKSEEGIGVEEGESEGNGVHNSPLRNAELKDTDLNETDRHEKNLINATSNSVDLRKAKNLNTANKTGGNAKGNASTPKANPVPSMVNGMGSAAVPVERNRPNLKRASYNKNLNREALSPQQRAAQKSDTHAHLFQEITPSLEQQQRELRGLVDGSISRYQEEKNIIERRRNHNDSHTITYGANSGETNQGSNYGYGPGQANGFDVNPHGVNPAVGVNVFGELHGQTAVFHDYKDKQKKAKLQDRNQGKHKQVIAVRDARHMNRVNNHLNPLNVPMSPLHQNQMKAFHNNPTSPNAYNRNAGVINSIEQKRAMRQIGTRGRINDDMGSVMTNGHEEYQLVSRRNNQAALSYTVTNDPQQTPRFRSGNTQNSPMITQQSPAIDSPDNRTRNMILPGMGVVATANFGELNPGKLDTLNVAPVPVNTRNGNGSNTGKHNTVNGNSTNQRQVIQVLNSRTKQQVTDHLVNHVTQNTHNSEVSESSPPRIPQIQNSPEVTNPPEVRQHNDSPRTPNSRSNSLVTASPGSLEVGPDNGNGIQEVKIGKK